VANSSVAQNNSGRRDVTETGLRRILIVIGVMAASLMQTLDTTITNVALPHIQGNLGASQDEGTWVVTAYTIAALTVIPLTPWLQERFGRKLYYTISIIGFTLASIACGSSSEFSALVFSRIVQGIFGGGLLATSQAILRDTFPPEQLGVSQGIYALGVVMGPALGPPLGGILVDQLSWNWCFDINVIPGIISTVIMITMLRDPDAAKKKSIDGIGVVLFALFVGTLQYVVTEGEQYDWFQDRSILLGTLVCFVSLIAFVIWELRGTKEPIVDLRLLANRSVWAGCILAMALGATNFGTSYVLPQYTQGPLAFTPTLSGELFLLRVLPILLLTIPVVRLLKKVDPRIFLGMGFLMLSIANGFQSQVTTLETSFWTFAFPLIFSGIGLGMMFTPLTTSVLGAVSPQDGAKAGAFTTLAVQFGGSLTIALLSIVVDQRQSFHSSMLASAASPAHLQLVGQSMSKLGGIAQQIYLQSTIMSYADATAVVAIICLGSIPLIFFLRRPRKVAAAHGE
jgi:DHA2 family multidrug resistance protein